MNKKNVHPIYFESFVGTWKMAENNSRSNINYLVFIKDCTYTHGQRPFEGTVNGDVDEVSIDGSEFDQIVRGKITLSTSDGLRKWQYILQPKPTPQITDRQTKGIKNRVLNELLLTNGQQTQRFELQEEILQAAKKQSRRVGAKL